MDADRLVVAQLLNAAQEYARAGNDWAEGYWLGRAVQHANQNAVDNDWLAEAFRSRGLVEHILEHSEFV